MVVAGEGTTVTGTGSQSNPYVVSATGSRVQGCDGPDVDVTVTGSGTESDPYTVCAAIDYSADPFNQAQPGTDGGLFVPPGAVDPCALVHPDQCNALCCTADGRLFVKQFIPSGVSLGMVGNQDVPRGPEGGGSSVTGLIWDTAIFNTDPANFAGVIQPDGSVCIQVNTPGIYAVDMNRRDTAVEANVGLSINLSILINGVRRAGSQTVRANSQSQRQEANGSYFLNAGDVICGQWSGIGNGGRTFEGSESGYFLQGDTRNVFTVTKLADPPPPGCSNTDPRPTCAAATPITP